MAGPLVVAALCAMIVLTIHTYTGWLYQLAPAAAQSMVQAYDTFMYKHFILSLGVGQTALLMLATVAFLAMLVIWLSEREAKPRNRMH
jgi:hypothetical protein